MFYEVQMLGFRFFRLSYFADVDLLLPHPKLGVNTGSLVGSVGIISNGWYDHWVIEIHGCWDESWRHWTDYYSICKRLCDGSVVILLTIDVFVTKCMTYSILSYS